MDIQKFVVNKETTYYIDGEKYTSLDEMPEDVREEVKFHEAMEMAGAPMPPEMGFSSQVKTERYEVNGQVYHSLEEMPPEHRALFADADGNGMPDMIDAAMQKVNIAGIPMAVPKSSSAPGNAPPSSINSTGGLSASQAWEQYKKEKQNKQNTETLDFKLFVGAIVGLTVGVAFLAMWLL